MMRAALRLLAAVASGMIANGSSGAAAHAQSTPMGQEPATKARPAMTEAAKVLTGIDVLAAGGFAPLQGLRVGLLTNPAGRTLRIDRLRWQGDTPVVDGPTVTPQPAP